MNLFDFTSQLPDYSNLNPTGKILSKPKQAPVSGAFGGGMSPPTINSAPLPSKKVVPNTMKGGYSPLIPTVSASEENDLLQSYLDDKSVPRKDRETVFKMIDDGLEVGEIEGMIKESGYGKIPETNIDKNEVVGVNGFFDGLNKNIGGFGSGFTKVLGNIAKAEAYLDPTNYLPGRDVSSIADENKRKTDALFQEKGAEDMGGYDVGNLMGEITALSLIPTSASATEVGAVLGKMSPQKLRALGEFVKSKVPKSAAVAESFINSIPNAGAFQYLDEGQITKGQTAFYASLGPLLNVMKSIPGISKIAGKSEILNAKAINEGEAIYQQGTKRLVGTTPELNASLDRVGGDSSKIARKNTQNAVSAIDLKGVRRPQDLEAVLDKKITELSNSRRELLNKESTLFTPRNSNVNYDYKGTTSSSSPVDDAFSDLDKAISAENRAKLNFLSDKFYNKGGLTSNELDELAKLHSKYNNAFETSGLVNKTKEGLESTRSGLKGLISNTEKGKVAEGFDKSMSPVIDLKKRVEEIRQAVDLGKSKIVLKLGEQASKIATNAFDAKTGRAVTRTFGSSGEVGASKMNMVEISKMLKSDLENIKKLTEGVDKTKSEKEALEFIEKFKFNPESPTINYGKIIPRKKNIPKPKK